MKQNTLKIGQKRMLEKESAGNEVRVAVLNAAVRSWWGAALGDCWELLSCRGAAGEDGSNTEGGLRSRSSRSVLVSSACTMDSNAS